MLNDFVPFSIIVSLYNPVLGLSSSSVGFTSVPRVDGSTFDPDIHYQHQHSNGISYETPVLIEDVLSREDCETACDTMINELGGNVVDLQRKTKLMDENGNLSIGTKIVKCKLGDAFGYMMESHRDDSFFCFCEGLLDENENESMVGLKDVFNRAKEKLFGSESNDNDDDSNRDLFHFFPEDMKPTDCVVVAGEGATSTLHRDPFEWTGTSLCLEGTKIWRFIAPPGAISVTLSQKDSDINSGVSQVDRALQSYRLPSTAWDDDIFLSSGWQSDMSLYAGISDDVPSAEELAMLEEEDGEEQKLNLIRDIASNLDNLSPSCDVLDSLCSNDDCSDSRTCLPLDVWTVVQTPGDLLVIPAYWWHQTYAMEPSIAIASQRCGSERDASRVFHHVLETMGNSHEHFTSKSDVERFKDLCDWLSVNKDERK